VGDGPNKKAVERLARRRGVSDSVIFTGSVPWDQVPAYTDAGDVFAMPCRTRLFGLEPEALGIVFLEAQACGLAVLIGDSGGASETLINGRGLVVVPGVEPTTRALAGMLRSYRDGRKPPKGGTASYDTSATTLIRLANVGWGEESCSSPHPTI
jgi:phosphatidylinositol alpha-1,6-mannosyltransferase